MSEEFSAGVRIVLERAKSNPEELVEDYGKWQHLREAVFDYKENGRRGGWVRGLRDDEIEALYELFCSCHRKVFDDWVMQQVLVEENVEQGLRESQVPQRVFTETQLKSRMKGVDRHGTWDNVTNQMSNTSLGNLVHGLNQGRK
jgi:hypothetical protein